MRDRVQRLRKDLSAREIDELIRSLTRRLGDSSLPTLNPVAVRILELNSDQASGMKDFAKVIQTDQALTGRLLRLANSAAFAQQQDVTTLQRAMVLIGLSRVRAMALGFHLCDSLDAGTDALRLWTQSVFRAWLAFHLADRFEIDVTGEAFVVGLLLEAGVPMMPRLLGDTYAPLAGKEIAPIQRLRIEHETMPFTHADVVAALAGVWMLPERLRTPLTTHHVAPRSVNRRDPASVLHAVAHVAGSVCLLDEDPGGPGRALPPATLDLLRLETNSTEMMLDRVHADFVSSREFFSSVLDSSIKPDELLAHAHRHLSAGHEADEPAQSSASVERIHRFESGGLLLELESADKGYVRAHLADATGRRFLSEVIDPQRLSDRAIAERLTLTGTPESEISRIIDCVRRLAA